MTPAADFWPGCGLQWLLARPELALVPESCAAEIALHESLALSPARVVLSAELVAVQDDDARENYTVFLRFRDCLLAAGTLEAYYLQLMRSGVVNVPAVFIDAVVQALLRNLLDNCNDAFEARARGRGGPLAAAKRCTAAHGAGQGAVGRQCGAILAGE